MLLANLQTVNELAKQLEMIDASVKSAQSVQILVNGRPIPPDLLMQLHGVGDPVVAKYFAAARAAIVDKLNALDVTET